MDRTFCFIAAVALAFTGCSSRIQESYSIPLTSVRRPADVQNRWGEYKMIEAVDGVTYEDELLQARATPSGGTFNLSITNKTPHSLQLIWDEAVYVDPRDYSSRIFSGDATMIETLGVGTSQTPTIIPAHAKTLVSAIPESLIRESGVVDFFADYEDLTPLRGMDIQLIVPIRVQDTVNEYTFVFTIESIERVKCAPGDGTWQCD